MQDEYSLVDYITNITPTDEYIIFPSVFGALLLIGYWYYKKFDTKGHFQLDETKKQFRLGYFYTGLVGGVGGSLLGILSRTRGGFDLESAGLLAFIGGMATPWLLVKAGHAQWDLVVRAAKHPILSQTQVIPQRALPLYHAGKVLTETDQAIMAQTGSKIAPIDEAGLQDWEKRRDMLMRRMLAWYQQNKITKQELTEIHAIYPAVGDVRKLLSQVQTLEGKQTDLTLADQMNYEKTILSYKQLIHEYDGTVQGYKRELERGKKAMDPQYQLTKQMIYGAFGFFFRQFLLWIGV